ncbi:MAG: hypothetical protein ACRD44_15895, partial [Bryobacteraceae bacterium]
MTDGQTRIARHAGGPNGRLESWKQIAAYLKRDVRTVQRWEAREGLPVHRHLHEKIASVYAFPDELDSWREGRRQDSPVNGRPSHRLLIWAAVATTVVGLAVLAMAMTGRNGRTPLTLRKVWEGAPSDHLGSISADGRLLAIRDTETADLAVIELETGVKRRLTHKEPKARIGGALYASFSPDARSIAYLWDLGTHLEVRLASTDDTSDRVIHPNSSKTEIILYGWSPDGLRLLVMQREANAASRLAVLDVSNGSVRAIRDTGPSHPLRASFSPDGRFIVYDLGSGDDATERDVSVARVSGSVEPVALVRHPGVDSLIGWAPDGRVLYLCDRTGSMDAWAVPVTDGRAGEPRLVKRDLGAVWTMNFTPDGAFYYGVTTAMVDVYTAVVDFERGTLAEPPRSASRRFAGVNQSPDWSPDGRFLAYLPRRSHLIPAGKARIVISEEATGQERVLEPELEFLDQIRWTADGSSFLAVAHDLAFQHGLFLIDARTGGRRMVAGTDGSRTTFHEAVQAGDRILYKRRNGHSEPAPLFWRPMSGRVDTEMASSVYRLALSPDGARLAYTTFDADSEVLRVLPSRGGAAVEVHREPRQGRIVSIAWTPDGRG